MRLCRLRILQKRDSRRACRACRLRQGKKFRILQGRGHHQVGRLVHVRPGLATQSLCLAAYALGLGTVIVGSLDHDKAKEVLE